MTKSLNEKAQAAAEEIALEFEPISSHQRNTLTTIANRTILRHFAEEQTPPQSLDEIASTAAMRLGLYSYLPPDITAVEATNCIKEACEEYAKELQSQLIAERERVKELEKDKERMDWIQRDNSKIIQTDHGAVFWCVQSDFHEDGISSDLRQAIDSAIAKQKGERV